MIAAVTSSLVTGALFPQVEWDVDDQGVTSANPILPPVTEIILQTLATAIIFGILFKFAGPPIKKYYADRSARIQRELDDAVAAKSLAEDEAAQIRTSLGDIDAERARLRAEAEEQAESLLVEGRARIEAEVAELVARADAEIAGVASRSGDELRGQIASHAARAVDLVVVESIDESIQQELIENFISRVGAGAGPDAVNGASA
jgi:F-type H+-transporting ATPase subunit b